MAQKRREKSSKKVAKKAATRLAPAATIVGSGCWLMKSEPGTYSIQDLERDGTTQWEGVRNFQARNFMRDHMKVGDRVLFYHSSTQPPGVAGLARVVREAYPDPYQFQKSSKYYDGTSDEKEPRWVLVDVAFEARFDDIVTLDALKAEPKLAAMLVIRRGMRLSVQPVEKRHFDHVVKLAGRKRG